MENTSNENIAEALKLLEEAARQKKHDLKAVIADKYTHLRNVLLEDEHALGQTLSEARKQAIEAAVRARDAGVEKAREVAGHVNECVHHNPWPYIAGSAAAGLLLGFMLGRNRK